MSPRFTVVAAATIGLCAALSVVLMFRMPVFFPGMFFPGTSVGIAAGLAFLMTLALLVWCPVHWLWSDGERLIRAFQARHNVSDLRASSALQLITQAHDRAQALRLGATEFQDDLKTQIALAADRLDGSAREIFYDPDRLNALRPILLRSELIAEAATSHEKLRRRHKVDDMTVVESRQALLGALDAMEQAFVSSDLKLAKGQMEEVKVASSVAETLLRPRGHTKPSQG